MIEKLVRLLMAVWGLEIVKHSTEQILVRFDNGYGASIIHRPGSYGYGCHLYELAVICWDGNDWSITYDTNITGDVMGYLTTEDVLNTLNDIQNLEVTV